MHVLPIASGKGGVGKTFLAANLAISMARSGRRVALVDLDLGASNLHLALGIPAPRKGVGTCLAENADLSSALQPTGYENLVFMAGDAEIPGLATLKAPQKASLMRKLLALEADYLVIDLGAGSHQNVLDFFLASPRGIVVTTPHLSATMGAYLFLKNCVFRLMTSSFEPKSRARAMLDELRKDGAAMQRVYVPDFAARIEAEDPASGAAFRSSLARFKPRLAMNMLSDPSDAGKATRIRRSAREYLGVDIEHLGALYRDTTQDVALASRLPVVAYKPDSVIAQGLAKMAERVTQMEDLDDRPLNSEFYDDTFEAAGLEAENDFEAKIAYLETLLGTGELSANDLVETIKSQQYEITQLRRENQSLKLKVARALERGFA